MTKIENYYEKVMAAKKACEEHKKQHPGWIDINFCDRCLIWNQEACASGCGEHCDRVYKALMHEMEVNK